MVMLFLDGPPSKALIKQQTISGSGDHTAFPEVRNRPLSPRFFSAIQPTEIPPEIPLELSPEMHPGIAFKFPSEVHLEINFEIYSNELDSPGIRGL